MEPSTPDSTAGTWGLGAPKWARKQRNDTQETAKGKKLLVSFL
jgi:hypothetical protein